MDLYSSEIYFSLVVKKVIEFYHSTAFGVIKFLIGIYVAVIIADIVLLLVVRGVSGNLREKVAGMDLPKELTNRRKDMRKKWEIIKSARLSSGNESEYKLAIIEADNLIDDLVKQMSYKGENFGERLNSIPEGQIESVRELKEAHEVRNRIIHEEDFLLSREEAEKVMEKYEAFLREFEVFD